MMKKTIAAGTIALTLAGAGFALAQQAPRARARFAAERGGCRRVDRRAHRRPQGGPEAQRRAGEELAGGRDRDPRSRQGSAPTA